MNLNNAFIINGYDFNSKVFNELQNIHYAKDLWPIIYILSDRKVKEAYVGETTDTNARMNTHLKNDIKNKLTTVHLITSEKFNKSATLDIESNLIKYISGDGQYKLLNANIGLANHSYYQKKEVYWDIFTSIWDNLRSKGLSKHSISHIDNSDLFKYSPYKSLSSDQKEGLLIILKSLLTKDFKNVIVEGGAGTGKTILAIFLFKLLNLKEKDFNFNEFGDEQLEFIQTIKELKKKYPDPQMALVVPMASFRKTLKKVFKNIKGLKSSMVIGPAEVASAKFDILVVDESHRLRRRVNLGAYYKSFDVACKKLNLNKHLSNELDWVNLQAKKTILFYDENQSVKPSDVEKEDFDKLKSDRLTKVEYLKSQFRVKGGNGYITYVDKLLNCTLKQSDNIYRSKDYEFLLFDSIDDLIKAIRLKNDKNGLSRLIAGYSWKWISKKNKKLYDIEIENTQLRWNRKAIDWINSVDSISEVGCIHTTQGYDLNYAAIIFGNEITYDKVKNEIVILKKNYFDTNGKNSINKPEQLKEYIINIYKTVMFRGIEGTYVYVCDPNLKEYLAQYITRYKPEKFIPASPVIKPAPFENSVPIYDLKAAAGDFSALQDIKDSEFEWVELPSRYKPSQDLFACRVEGESMNKIIPNGSICLFRKDGGGSRNGKIVLVKHTSIQDPDFGSGYTIKEYHSKKNTENDQWRHDSITLKPLSYNSEYINIELSGDKVTGLKVVGTFECVL